MQANNTNQASSVLLSSSEHNYEQDKALACFHLAVKSELIAMLNKIISEQESQEVFQEALLKIYFMASQNPLPHTFIEKLEALRPMLFKVAKNMAISRVRHIQVRERYVQELQERSEDMTYSNITSIESMLMQQTTTELLHKAINQLPPICKTVFIERKVHGLSHAQIANQLNISKKTVESHISKGLKLCRAFLRGQEDKRSQQEYEVKANER